MSSDAIHQLEPFSAVSLPNDVCVHTTNLIKNVDGFAASIIPLRHVNRRALPSNCFSGSAQLLASNNDGLQTCLEPDSVLLALFPESESRSKQIICIERLDMSLYGVLQISATVLPVKKIMLLPSYNDLGRESAVGIDFKMDTWWQSLVVPASLVNTSSESISLDLGPQTAKLHTASPQTSIMQGQRGDAIINSYHETLYRTKTPLVFFAKSILPRLSQDFLQRKYSDLDLSKYIQNRVVPSLSDLDAKYKHGIPKLARAFADGTDFICESLGKDEVSYVRAWLEICASSAGPTTSDTILSQFLQPLKMREYQLIILLLLEAMIHSVGKKKDVTETDGQASIHQDTLQPDVYIDVLLDRISIGQSLDFTQSEDVLKTFCIEVVHPFFASRLPEFTQTIYRKCVPDELALFGSTYAQTLAKRAKLSSNTRRNQKNSVTLKRNQSALDKLLSDKRPVVKRRPLGREISMTKRVPSFEIKKEKSTAVRVNSSFEDLRRQRLERDEQQKVQVGQTPAKPKNMAPSLIPQLKISETSKASFMAIGETPKKNSSVNEAAVIDTPKDPLQTPQREPAGSVSYALADGVQDSPSGHGIHFKLNDPSLSDHRRGSLEGVMDRSIFSSPEVFFRTPAKLGKSVTFAERSTRSSGGFFDKLLDASRNTIRPREPNNSTEATTPKAPRDFAGSPMSLAKEQTLENALDWL